MRMSFVCNECGNGNHGQCVNIEKIIKGGTSTHCDCQHREDAKSIIRDIT